MASAPPNQTLNREDGTTLSCGSMGGPGNAFRWLFNGETIPGENAPELTLQNISASTGGRYSCIISNPAGNDTSDTFVFVAPYFVEQPTDSAGTNGSAVSATCRAESFPEAQYQWERADGEPIRGEVPAEAATLRFAPILFGDEGDHYCNATAGNATTQSQTATISGEIRVP